eukprot:NP_509064.2 Uncharacterized protein CELE_C03B1.6 [Caenorhabditis elegans]
MFISSVFRFFFLLNLFFFVVVLSYFFIQIYSQNFNAAVADLDLMDKSKTLFERELELAAILQVPVTKRYGIVEIEEKPHKRYYRPEVLKIYMRRNYPTLSMRSDLMDALNKNFQSSTHAYFRHSKVTILEI